MWNYIDTFLISLDHLLVDGLEHLIFLMVVFLIVVIFSLILKVSLAILKERITHQIHMNKYNKLLVLSKKEIVKNNLDEKSFNKKQAVLIQDIFELKNQCISLRLFLNSLSKT